jgi:hypothetical protein
MKEMEAVPKGVEAMPAEAAFAASSRGSALVVPRRSRIVSARAVVPVSLRKLEWARIR